MTSPVNLRVEATPNYETPAPGVYQIFPLVPAGTEVFSPVSARGRGVETGRSSQQRSRSVKISLETRNEKDSASLTIELDDPEAMVEKVLTILSARFPVDAFYSVIANQSNLIRRVVTDEQSPNVAAATIEARLRDSHFMAEVLPEDLRRRWLEFLSAQQTTVTTNDQKNRRRGRRAGSSSTGGSQKERGIYEEEGKWERLDEEELLADRETEHSSKSSSSSHSSSRQRSRDRASGGDKASGEDKASNGEKKNRMSSMSSLSSISEAYADVAELGPIINRGLSSFPSLFAHFVLSVHPKSMTEILSMLSITSTHLFEELVGKMASQLQCNPVMISGLVDYARRHPDFLAWCNTLILETAKYETSAQSSTQQMSSTQHVSSTQQMSTTQMSPSSQSAAMQISGNQMVSGQMPSGHLDIRTGIFGVSSAASSRDEGSVQIAQVSTGGSTFLDVRASALETEISRALEQHTSSGASMISAPSIQERAVITTETTVDVSELIRAAESSPMVSGTPPCPFHSEDLLDDAAEQPRDEIKLVRLNSSHIDDEVIAEDSGIVYVETHNEHWNVPGGTAYEASPVYRKTLDQIVDEESHAETMSHHDHLIQHESATTTLTHESVAAHHESTISHHESVAAHHESTIGHLESTIAALESTTADHESMVGHHESMVVQETIHREMESVSQEFGHHSAVQSSMERSIGASVESSVQGYHNDEVCQERYQDIQVCESIGSGPVGSTVVERVVEEIRVEPSIRAEPSVVSEIITTTTQVTTGSISRGQEVQVRSTESPQETTRTAHFGSAEATHSTIAAPVLAAPALAAPVAPIVSGTTEVITETSDLHRTGEIRTTVTETITTCPTQTTVSEIRGVSQTVSGSVDLSQTTVDVSRTAVDVSRTAVDVSRTAVDVSQSAVDLSQSALDVARSGGASHIEMTAGHSSGISNSLVGMSGEVSRTISGTSGTVTTTTVIETTKTTSGGAVMTSSGAAISGVMTSSGAAISGGMTSSGAVMTSGGAAVRTSAAVTSGAVEKFESMSSGRMSFHTEILDALEKEGAYVREVVGGRLQILFKHLKLPVPEAMVGQFDSVQNDMIVSLLTKNVEEMHKEFRMARVLTLKAVSDILNTLGYADMIVGNLSDSSDQSYECMSLPDKIRLFGMNPQIFVALDMCREIVVRTTLMEVLHQIESNSDTITLDVNKIRTPELIHQRKMSHTRIDQCRLNLLAQAIELNVQSDLWDQVSSFTVVSYVQGYMLAADLQLSIAHPISRKSSCVSEGRRISGAGSEIRRISGEIRRISGSGGEIRRISGSSGEIRRISGSGVEIRRASGDENRREGVWVSAERQVSEEFEMTEGEEMFMTEVSLSFEEDARRLKETVMKKMEELMAKLGVSVFSASGFQEAPIHELCLSAWSEFLKLLNELGFTTSISVYPPNTTSLLGGRAPAVVGAILNLVEILTPNNLYTKKDSTVIGQHLIDILMMGHRRQPSGASNGWNNRQDSGLSRQFDEYRVQVLKDSVRGFFQNKYQVVLNNPIYVRIFSEVRRLVKSQPWYPNETSTGIQSAPGDYDSSSPIRSQMSVAKNTIQPVVSQSQMTQSQVSHSEVQHTSQTQASRVSQPQVVSQPEVVSAMLSDSSEQYTSGGSGQINSERLMVTKTETVKTTTTSIAQPTKATVVTGSTQATLQPETTVSRSVSESRAISEIAEYVRFRLMEIFGEPMEMPTVEMMEQMRPFFMQHQNILGPVIGHVCVSVWTHILQSILRMQNIELCHAMEPALPIPPHDTDDSLLGAKTLVTTFARAAALTLFAELLATTQLTSHSIDAPETLAVRMGIVGFFEKSQSWTAVTRMPMFATVLGKMVKFLKATQPWCPSEIDRIEQSHTSSSAQVHSTTTTTQTVRKGSSGSNSSTESSVRALRSFFVSAVEVRLYKLLSEISSGAQASGARRQDEVESELRRVEQHVLVHFTALLESMGFTTTMEELLSARSEDIAWSATTAEERRAWAIQTIHTVMESLNNDNTHYKRPSRTAVASMKVAIQNWIRNVAEQRSTMASTSVTEQMTSTKVMTEQMTTEQMTTGRDYSGMSGLTSSTEIRMRMCGETNEIIELVKKGMVDFFENHSVPLSEASLDLVSESGVEFSGLVNSRLVGALGRSGIEESLERNAPYFESCVRRIQTELVNHLHGALSSLSFETQAWNLMDIPNSPRASSELQSLDIALGSLIMTIAVRQTLIHLLVLINSNTTRTNFASHTGRIDLPASTLAEMDLARIEAFKAGVHASMMTPIWRTIGAFTAVSAWLHPILNRFVLNTNVASNLPTYHSLPQSSLPPSFSQTVGRATVGHSVQHSQPVPGSSSPTQRINGSVTYTTMTLDGGARFGQNASAERTIEPAPTIYNTIQNFQTTRTYHSADRVSMGADRIGMADRVPLDRMSMGASADRAAYSHTYTPQNIDEPTQTLASSVHTLGQTLSAMGQVLTTAGDRVQNTLESSGLTPSTRTTLRTAMPPQSLGPKTLSSQTVTSHTLASQALPAQTLASHPLASQAVPSQPLAPQSFAMHSVSQSVRPMTTGPNAFERFPMTGRSPMAATTPLVASPASHPSVSTRNMETRQHKTSPLDRAINNEPTTYVNFSQWKAAGGLMSQESSEFGVAEARSAEMGGRSAEHGARSAEFGRPGMHTSVPTQKTSSKVGTQIASNVAQGIISQQPIGSSPLQKLQNENPNQLLGQLAKLYASTAKH